MSIPTPPQVITKIITLANELSKLGAGKLDIGFPRIVVVGEQSSGKSSVLSKLAGGIRLPRGEGTCTKCPLELQMRTSDEEDCNIQLQWVSENGIIELTTPSEVKYADIEEEVRKAQKKLCGNKEFTESCIILNLKGPDLPNLTLIDLPGIYRSKGTTSTTKDNETREFVRKLLHSYVKLTTTIVLAIIPCEGEVNNNEVFDILEKIDNDYQSRTLGVLTKCDMLEHYKQEKKEVWIKIMEGKIYQLKLDWVMVNADPKEGNEVNFNSHPIWSDQNKFPGAKFGVKHLARKLAKIYSRTILEHLPGLESKAVSLKSKLEKEFIVLNTQYKDIFEDDCSPSVKASQMLFKIKELLETRICALKGNIFIEEIIYYSDITKHYEDLHDTILYTCPLYIMPRNQFHCLQGQLFYPFDISTVVSNNFPEWLTNWKVPDNEGRFFCPIPECKEELNKGNFKSHFQGKHNIICQISQNTFENDWEQVKIDIVHSNGFLQFLQKKELDNIKKKVHTCRGRLLPGQIPNNIIVELIRDFSKKWENPSMKCVENVADTLKNLFKIIVEDVLRLYPNFKFFVNRILANILTERVKKAKKTILRLLELEKYPFTLNVSTSNRANGEPYEQIVARAQSYFHIVSKRYIDFSGISIDAVMIRNLPNCYLKKYMTWLSSKTTKELEALLMGDKNVILKHKCLDNRIKNLQKMLDKLQESAVMITNFVLPTPIRS